MSNVASGYSTSTLSQPPTLTFAFTIRGYLFILFLGIWGTVGNYITCDYKSLTT
jgi:hypothetical protein